MDSRYETQAAPPKYEDESAQAKLSEYRDAAQRLSAHAQSRPGNNTRHNELKYARVYAARNSDAPATGAASAAIPMWVGGAVNSWASVDQSAFARATTASVAATCSTCLSPSSLSTCDGSVFCSLCNRKALLPRVSAQTI